MLYVRTVLHIVSSEYERKREKDTYNDKGVDSEVATEGRTQRDCWRPLERPRSLLSDTRNHRLSVESTLDLSLIYRAYDRGYWRRLLKRPPASAYPGNLNNGISAILRGNVTRDAEEENFSARIGSFRMQRRILATGHKRGKREYIL